MELEHEVNRKPLGIANILDTVLIAAGALGLLFGDFSFNKACHELKLGPLELAVSDKQTLPVPTRASLAAIAAGVGLLVFGGRQVRVKGAAAPEPVEPKPPRVGGLFLGSLKQPCVLASLAMSSHASILDLLM